MVKHTKEKLKSNNFSLLIGANAPIPLLFYTYDPDIISL